MMCRVEGRRLPSTARKGFLAAGLAGLLLTGTLPAVAQPITKTKLKYYSISGNSGAELVQQLNARGPWHGGARAFGHIDGKPAYAVRLAQGTSCRIENLKVTAEFTMTLPKLAAGTRLPAALNGQWKSFEKFVRLHEEQHRAIWLDALNKAERRIRGLRSRSCTALRADIKRVFDSAWQAADQRHVAFDVAEQNRLMRHPLIVAELAGGRSKTAAAVRQTHSSAALRPASAQRPQSCGSAVVVGRGDTLAGIAARCGTTASAVIRANQQIMDPDTIHAGQTIRIPGG